MVKELVRILGISCILAGAFLYFYTSPKGDAGLQEENNMLNEQVAQLQTKLEQTEKELSNLQTITSKATENTEDEEKEIDEDKSNENDPSSEEKSVAKLTLTIESGTTSKDVASALERANIIEDKKTFNDYLKAQKLTTKIQIGDHDVDALMSTEMIAKLITTLPADR